jgi:lysyl-tRNA synthetase class I
VKSQFPLIIKDLIQALNEEESIESEEKLTNRTWEIMKSHGVEGKTFFKDVYQILVSKPNGPKLASFLLAIGPKRAAEILQKAL